MENSIREFASNNPGLDYRMLVDRFGSPQKIAESCVDEMEPTELLESMHIRQKILIILTGAAALLSIMRFGFHILAYVDHAKNMQGYAVVEVIEVENVIFETGVD